MPGVMRVKPLALACAVMMTLTLLLTWNRLYLASPQPQELIQQDAPEYDDSEVDPPSWTTQLYENEFFLQQQSTYSPFLFDRQENVFQPATAIVSRVDENENGLLAVIKHLSKYPFIKEILIYNQLNKPLVEVNQIMTFNM
jgi:hypothetical protein